LAPHLLRYYDPATGRFTRADPIGLGGGLNLYGFAGGDPVSNSDPFGLCPDPADPTCSLIGRVTSAISNWFSSAQGKAAQALAQGVAVVGRVMTSLVPGSRRAAEAVSGIDESGSHMTGGQRVAAVAGAVAEGAVNVAGGEATESAILNAAERWLGRGYREIAPGVFRSADDAHQFRMVSSNLSRAVPHVNFEAVAADGRTILENSHVSIVP